MTPVFPPRPPKPQLQPTQHPKPYCKRIGEDKFLFAEEKYDIDIFLVEFHYHIPAEFFVQHCPYLLFSTLFQNPVLGFVAELMVRAAKYFADCRTTSHTVFCGWWCPNRRFHQPCAC